MRKDRSSSVHVGHCQREFLKLTIQQIAEEFIELCRRALVRHTSEDPAPGVLAKDRLMAITGAAGLALQVDAQRAVHGNRSIASIITEMTGHLDALILAQEARDWDRIADVLQHGDESALRRWRPVIEVFARPA